MIQLEEKRYVDLIYKENAYDRIKELKDKTFTEIMLIIETAEELIDKNNKGLE